MQPGILFHLIIKKLILCLLYTSVAHVFSSPGFAKSKKRSNFVLRIAEIAQSVEHQLPKLRVAGSNPVFRSKRSLQTSFFVGGGREGAGRASNPHPADNGNAPVNGRIPISAWRDAPTKPDRYRTAVPPSPATGSVQTENRRTQALRAAS